MHAVVVGAGLAGLSAAVRLEELGHDVTVVERSRLLGGKATSFTIEGIEVDSGQHVHLACCTEYLDFVDSLGMAAMLFTQARFSVTVLRRGAAAAMLAATPRLPTPVQMLPGFARYTPVGLRGRLRIATALRHLDDPVDAAETFAAWLRRQRQTDDGIRGFWNIFVVPAVNAGLDEVSAADALFVVRTAFANPDGARIGWSRVPLARIAEAAAARATAVRLRTAITGVVDDGARVTGVRCADGERIDADAVVLAVPPQRLRGILGGEKAFGLRDLEAFESRAIVDVHLWFDTADLGFEFAAVVDSAVQWVFQKAPGYVACSLSAADRLVTRSKDELIELCHRELLAVWPRLAGARLLRGAVTRDADATFVPRPGLRRPGPATQRPNLAIAGAWTGTGWPATMESAVRSGRAAAELVAGAAGSRRQPAAMLERVGG